MTTPTSPPPPPPPPETETGADGFFKKAWSKFRSWPLWAQVLIGLVLLLVVVGAAGGGETDEEPVSADTTTTSVAETTTTTEATTTTTESTTTTEATTTTTLTPEQEREIAVVAMGVVFEDQRLSFAELLADLTDVETVDRLAFENETVIIDITSTWASPDNQHDGAWTLMKAMAQFWEPNEGIWWQEAFVPNFQLVNSGRVYNCSGDFMVDMATLRAGRNEWEASCG